MTGISSTAQMPLEHLLSLVDEAEVTIEAKAQQEDVRSVATLVATADTVDEYELSMDCIAESGRRVYLEYRYADKGIYMVELPRQEHAQPLGWITKLLNRYDLQQNTRAGATCDDEEFEMLGETCERLFRRSKGADVAMRRKGRPVGVNAAARAGTGAWPNMVVEVGWCETLPELVQDAADWLDPSTDLQVSSFTCCV
jgi:hypothetical protein